MKDNEMSSRREELDVQAERERQQVRSALESIDHAQLQAELEGGSYREIFVEAAMSVLDSEELSRRIAANLDHPDWSFSEVVRDAVADLIARQTPRGWVEPMYVSGTRPPRTLCELIRDKILESLGRTHGDAEQAL